MPAGPVDDALSRLATPPTNAPIAPPSRPETSIPDSSAPPGWLRADLLRDPGVWHRLARAYSEGLRTPHLPVGGACGLQHYAGRFALAVLGVWVQTGRVLSVQHSRWWLQLDDRGHTTSVSAPDTSDTATDDSVAAVAHAVLVEHMRPVVDAVRAATRITDKVAFGCIAASCAGAFGALHRRCGPADRARLRALAEQFLQQPNWPVQTPLVRFTELELDAGTALVHERHVCCLIRLGEGHGACETCPDIDPVERAERTRARAAAAGQAADLPVATAPPAQTPRRDVRA